MKFLHYLYILLGVTIIVGATYVWKQEELKKIATSVGYETHIVTTPSPSGDTGYSDGSADVLPTNSPFSTERFSVEEGGFSFTYPSYEPSDYWSTMSWPPRVSRFPEEKCEPFTSEYTKVDVLSVPGGATYCYTTLTAPEEETDGDRVTAYFLHGFTKEGIYVQIGDTGTQLTNCDNFPGKEEECKTVQAGLDESSFLAVLISILNEVKEVEQVVEEEVGEVEIEAQ